MPTHPSHPTRPQVGIYCRVSTEEQKRRQSPIETQRDVCRAECERLWGAGGYLGDEYVDEGFSGTLGREAGDNGRGRPAYLRLLQAIAAGTVTHVVVQDLDRLARDELEIAQLVNDLARHSVLIVTPGRQYDPASPDDRLLIGIRAVTSAHQPRQTAVKVKQGLSHRARSGYLPTGRVGYGWRLQRRDEYPEDGKRGIAPVPEEGRWVVTIKDLYLRGWGVTRIARHLNEQHAPAPRGVPTWTVWAVRSVLFSPVHAGLVTIPNPQGGELPHARGAHFDQRYYDPATFEAILERKTRAARRRNPGASSAFFLSGVLRCGACGRPLVAATHPKVRYYQCPRGWAAGVADCPGVMLRAEEIERATVDYFQRLVGTPEFAALARGELEHLLDDDGANLEKRLGEIDKRQRDLDRQMDWLIEQAARQPNLRARFDHKCAAWQAEQAKLQEEAGHLQARLANGERRVQDAQRVHVVLADFVTTWGALDCDERREMAHLLLETATADQGEGEVVVHLKAPFLPEQEVRLPMRHWAKRPRRGPLALTLRECEALHLRGQGLSHAQIAARWGTRPNASAVRLGKALEKLQVATVEEALELCGEHIAQRAQAVPPDRHTGGRRAGNALTARERELLPRIADTTVPYSRLAQQLGLAPVTVYAHAANILRKLGLADRAELADHLA